MKHALEASHSTAELADREPLGITSERRAGWIIIDVIVGTLVAVNSVALGRSNCGLGPRNAARGGVGSQLEPLVEEAMAEVDTAGVGGAPEELVGVFIESAVHAGEHHPDAGLTVAQILLEPTDRVIALREPLF